MSPDIVKCSLVHCGFQAHHEPSVDTTGASEEEHAAKRDTRPGRKLTVTGAAGAHHPEPLPFSPRSQEKEDVVSALSSR